MLPTRFRSSFKSVLTVPDLNPSGAIKSEQDSPSAKSAVFQPKVKLNRKCSH